MKEELYTIPVNEAFDKQDECAFCALHQNLEKDILDYVMGPSYMEEDVRGETDRLGFCEEHYRQMFQAGNRLGLALMLSTHMKKLRADMQKLLPEELEAADSGRRGLFKKQEAAGPFVQYAQEVEDSCYACRRMAGRMNSYVDTFFYLWKKEPEFRQKVLSGKGFCLKHFKRVMEEGKKRLLSAEYRDFLKQLIPVQTENFQRVEEDVDWFIQKFDYRFQKEPWKNSKDAVERAILKIAGVNVGEGEKK